jgi:hypothetical protein
MNYDWKDSGNDTHYYFKTDNGLIVGQTHNIAHTKIYLAIAMFGNEEKFLGRFVTLDYAKKAIQLFWNVQDLTLLESS